MLNTSLRYRKSFSYPNAWRSFVASILTHATFNRVFIAPRIQVLQTIDNDDQLDVPGSPTVIHVPGHTPGEVAYSFPRSNVTITGDSIVTLNLFTGECGGPQLPHRLLNADDKQSRSSLDKLTDLGQTTILPGHGQPWHGNLEEAIASVRKTQSDGPRSRRLSSSDDLKRFLVSKFSRHDLDNTRHRTSFPSPFALRGLKHVTEDDDTTDDFRMFFGF